MSRIIYEISDKISRGGLEVLMAIEKTVYCCPSVFAPILNYFVCYICFLKNSLVVVF